METKHQKALLSCHAKLAGTDSHDHKAIGNCIYRMGVALFQLGEVEQAIRCFNDAFLMRAEDTTGFQDFGWKDFHDVQMTMYIMGKRQKCISSLAEGDMVHDLIKNRWKELVCEMESSEICFVGTNKRLWFSTVRIDFPWDIESIVLVDEDDLSQFDQMEAEFLDECVKITH
jgi:hypothetical protein